MFCILTGKEVLSGCYALDACHYCTSLPQSLGGCVDSLQTKKKDMNKLFIPVTLI